MKIILITNILCLSMILSCTNSTPTTKGSQTDMPYIGTNDSLGKVALGRLFDKINKLPKVRFVNNQILIGDTSIRLKINVEFDGQKGEEWIYAANISTYYKTSKETQIDIGSVGIGSNKEEALNVCIQEWFAIFGIPFTNMLKEDKPLSISDMKVFSGLMGVRGNLPENTWLKGDDEMTKKIIGQIQEQIKRETTEIIPVDIKLMVGKNGISAGECRIGSKVSNQLLESLKQLNWPSSGEGYMFKQFYLVKIAGR